MHIGEWHSPRVSVLIVSLFATAINGITSRFHCPVLDLYVDFTVYYRSHSLPATERQLQPTNKGLSQNFWLQRLHVYISASSGDFRQLSDVGTTHPATPDQVSAISQHVIYLNCSLLGTRQNNNAWALSLSHLFSAQLWIPHLCLYIQESFICY